MRCRADCDEGGSARPCGALAAYRATGRVAFPERAAEISRRSVETERGRTHRKAAESTKKKPKPSPPVSGSKDNLLAIAWRRYLASLRKYAVVEGRSSRTDLVSFLGIEFCVCLAASLIGAGAIVLLATAVPAWALTVRRLHDIDRSGRWLWLVLVWPIAVCTLPVMLLWPGSEGPNRYGVPPA